MHGGFIIMMIPLSNSQWLSHQAYVLAQGESRLDRAIKVVHVLITQASSATAPPSLLSLGALMLLATLMLLAQMRLCQHVLGIHHLAHVAISSTSC